MSTDRDDYALPNENPDQTDVEPADPTSADPAARRSLPLAPDSVKTARLPKPFVSDKGGVLTVEEARETYLRVERSNWESDSRTSKYERHRFGVYPRILEADRHFRVEYEGLTTAMLSRRLSPLDDNRDWLTPWECNEMLHGGSIHRSIRGAISYQLDGFAYEWVAVTAPTRSAGTPHEHIYLWIDDSENEVTTEHFAPALEKHLKRCPNAYEEHHRIRASGNGGAITVQHSPALIGNIPAEFWNIRDQSQTYKETGSVVVNTRGAQYLASQLAHLPPGDYYRECMDDPPNPLLEGAALAWASPYNWFRGSKGVPMLDET